MAKLFANSTIGNSYKEALQKRHALNEKWGGSAKYASSSNILQDIERRGYINSLLDFGAGKQGFGKMLKKHYPDIEYTPYDPGMPDIDVLPDRKFDMVCSNDVMEHIEPHLIEEVIKAQWDRTKFVLINNIACSEAGSDFEGTDTEWDGQNLHLIIEPTEWWVDLHKRAINDPKMSIMSITKVLRRRAGGFRERCQLVIERAG